MRQRVQLFIDGQWTDGVSRDFLPIENPATGEVVGEVASAAIADLDVAAEAARRSFPAWSGMPALGRSSILRQAAALLAERADTIARQLTIEQGKPLAQARAEVMVGVDVIEWAAEEGRRTYGRVIPARSGDVLQMTVKEPVGPVAAFAPWNFPINQSVRKLAAALATGCTIVLKGPEEAPSACAELVRAFADAGVPPGVVNLVFGNPAEISGHLIPHPAIRKISFTGSTAIGKQLAALAGLHMKKATMELGGHAPVIVLDDCDLDHALDILSLQKVRNAGQVCVAPTRFIVQEAIHDRFVHGLVTAFGALRVGDGLDPETQMGPLAHARRIETMQALVDDAADRGAKIHIGGRRIGNKGHFFEPTVLTAVPNDARIMNEEPFGPLAPVVSFQTLDEAIAEANRLPYGLAAYAYTASMKAGMMLSNAIEAGNVSINHHGVAVPETPFGGIKDSGYGSEGGIEALDAYLNTKFVTQKMV